jgi:hypothetical protein
MKHPTVLVALLATGLVLAFVLTGLVVSSHERDLCQNSASESDSCSVKTCTAIRSSVLPPVDQPTPTLAPPRPEISGQKVPSSNELVTGQPVFLKVETDQNEIEVGWATP